MESHKNTSVPTTMIAVHLQPKIGKPTRICLTRDPYYGGLNHKVQHFYRGTAGALPSSFLPGHPITSHFCRHEHIRYVCCQTLLPSRPAPWSRRMLDLTSTGPPTQHEAIGGSHGQGFVRRQARAPSASTKAEDANSFACHNMKREKE
jgi:hypothetical protein